MIDIHCHILPGADYGAKHRQASIQMAKDAIGQGIDTIIATPHHHTSRFDNPKQAIIEQVKQLQQIFDEEHISVRLIPGQVTRLYGELLAGVEQGEILPVNETTRYVLLELPTDHIPQYTNQLLFDLQTEGYKPIIVHPEQNEQVLDNPNVLYGFVKLGALAQVSALSVAGKMGKKVQKLTNQLVESNLVHFIASEASNTTNQGFYMVKAKKELRKNFGEALVNELDEHAERMINDESVIGREPLRIKKKKIFGLI